jgi:hypothetical protein
MLAFLMPMEEVMYHAGSKRQLCSLNNSTVKINTRISTADDISKKYGRVVET